MAEIDSNYRYLTYEEMGKEVAEKALDEFLYNGKSIREWMQTIVLEDCISRKSAILDIQRHGVGCFDADDFNPEQAERFVINRLNGLPSVQPKPKTGRWIIADNLKAAGHFYKCSECNHILAKSNFCPNCGAKMVEPQESEVVEEYGNN